MSIANKITELNEDVNAIFNAIIAKGITVSDRHLNLIPGYIAQIKPVSPPEPVDITNISAYDITTKLEKILDIKNQIKTVLMNSGVQGVTDVFSSYDTFISAIQPS